MTPAGALTTLHSFNSTDGANPTGALTQAANGLLWGTTYGGGANGYGTIFKMTPAGELTTLHSFALTDGSCPESGLVQATNGNFYGMTSEGGDNSFGTIFELSGLTLTTLHSFDVIDGVNPFGGIVEATDGNFYGTTEYDGANDGGTVFRLAAGLGPFVTAPPTSGTVGEAIEILGTNLTGAPHVTFNSTTATFTVISASEISATVPAGATTGNVSVTTPFGILYSTAAFRVTP